MKPRACSWRRLRAALLLSAWASSAFGAPCGRPDVDITFPRDGAESVPTNAFLTAHYSNPALYDDELVVLTDSAGNDVPLTTSFDQAETLVRAVPDAPLSGGAYTAEWPALRGVAGGLGLGKKVKFFVQNLTDTTPPVFAGLAAIDWDLSRDRDPCTDALEDRFVFKLELGAASDDAAVSLLALSIFQTKDPRAPEAPPSKVALRAWPESGELEVRRAATEAGTTCFAAIAQDLVGSVSGGGEREVCVKTKQPPFFDGCSLRGPNPNSGHAGLFLVMVALGSRLARRGRFAVQRSNPAR